MGFRFADRIIRAYKSFNPHSECVRNSVNKQIILNGVAAFLPEKHRIIAINSDQPPLSLSIPASRCLALLINHQGEVVLREKFFHEVWVSNGAQVTNNTFYQNISLLRRAFKEFGLNEDYIVTVPKVGVKLENTLKITRSEEGEIIITERPLLATPVKTPPRKVVRSLPASLTKGWVGASALVFVLCLGAAFLTWRASTDNRFAEFKPLITQSSCHYFVNYDTSDYKKHRLFVRDFNLNCDSFKYVYLTAYNNFARFSAVACERPFSAWRENNCVTHYVITEDSNAFEK